MFQKKHINRTTSATIIRDQKGVISFMYNSIIAMLNIQRILAPPDYMTYVGWILSKKHYGKMKRGKLRR